MSMKQEGTDNAKPIEPRTAINPPADSVGVPGSASPPAQTGSGEPLPKRGRGRPKGATQKVDPTVAPKPRRTADAYKDPSRAFREKVRELNELVPVVNAAEGSAFRLIELGKSRQEYPAVPMELLLPAISGLLDMIRTMAAVKHKPAAAEMRNLAEALSNLTRYIPIMGGDSFDPRTAAIIAVLFAAVPIAQPMIMEKMEKKHNADISGMDRRASERKNVEDDPAGAQTGKPAPDPVRLDLGPDKGN